MIDTNGTLVDSDGENVTDAQETANWTDPLYADVDGDGLEDGEEYELLPFVRNSPTLVYGVDATSNPEVADTDRDGLDDAGEKQWGTNALRPDTDDDGYADNVDPRVRTEDIAPRITDISFAGEGLVVTARDASPGLASLSVSATNRVQIGSENGQPSFDVNWTALDGSFERINETTGRFVVPHEALVDRESTQSSIGSRVTSPDSVAGAPGDVLAFRATAVDENGNTLQVAFRRNESGVVKIGEMGSRSGGLSDTAVLTSAGVLAASTGTATVEATVLGTTVTISTAKVTFVIVAVVALAAITHHAITTVDVELPRAETVFRGARFGVTAGTLATVPGSALIIGTTVGGSPVTLREGYAFGARAGLIPRGYGMAYVAATSSVTQSQIETAMRNPHHTIRNGRERIIIGPAEEGILIITTIGGVIHTATEGNANGEGDTVEDHCGRDVYVPTENENAHPYKDGITRDDIISALQNPFNNRIWAVSDGFYYIAQASNGVWFMVHVTKNHPEVALAVSTTLSELAGDWRGGQGGEDTLQEDKDATEYDC